jgi:hypothetical protein
MLRTEDLPVNLPFVVAFDIGVLEPHPGIALQSTYATSQERFEARQWDRTVFGFPMAVAIELARVLQRETGLGRPPDDASRH